MTPPVIAILGATGAVGEEFLRILEQRRFPVGELRLLASSRSAGRKLRFRGRLLTVEEVSEASFKDVSIGLFSAGGSVSKRWAPVAAAAGAVVVDNTSFFRMDPAVPLVVPEVNGDELDARPPKGIIANPNCSTVPVVMAMKPLNELWALQRIVACTYQSVSGKGAQAVAELREESKARLEGRSIPPGESFPHPIAFNLLPHIDEFEDDGYTREELKMLNESRKMLRLPGLRVSATCVRVPVFRSHCVSVNATFARKVSVEEARAALAAAPGMVVVDRPERREYPMPLYAEGLDETFAGRIRLDASNPDGTGLEMFLASDNLRKGAALNAVQIAERLLDRPWFAAGA